jgi:hypothetical protein
MQHPTAPARGAVRIDRVKWSRAVHHLESLAQTCAEMADKPKTLFPTRVVQLWAVGDLLGAARDVESITVALAVDLPVDEVPWLGEPRGAQHWAYAARLTKNPIVPLWRSVHAPVWNHYIDRPALVWDSTDGMADETVTALREGRGNTVRPPAPTDEERRARLNDELRVSLLSLRNCHHDYAERRWKPGKLEPFADALWRASDGYLDVLDATSHG